MVTGMANKMDAEVKSWIETFNGYRGDSRLTDKQERAYNGVSSDRVRNQLQNLHPGECVQVESLCPEDGAVIFFDGVHGRKTLSLDKLGYDSKNPAKMLGQGDGEDMWFPGQTLFERCYSC